LRETRRRWNRNEHLDNTPCLWSDKAKLALFKRLATRIIHGQFRMITTKMDARDCIDLGIELRVCYPSITKHLRKL
jgi:predicted peroxiredoxin